MCERSRMLVAGTNDIFLWMKVKEWFWSCISLRLFFGHCHVTFPYREILSFFGLCHVTFPYMDPLCFFGRLRQKVIVSCFSDSLVPKTTQQSDGSCNVTSDFQLFYKQFQKQRLFSANTYGKYIASNECCFARHDDKMCFLPNCRYHIVLIGNIKELLQNLDAFCFNYQHVECLYTIFKYRFSRKIVIKSGKIFDNLQRAVHFNQQNKGDDRMPSFAKKRILKRKKKNTKNNCCAPSKRQNRQKLLGQSLTT